MALTSSNAVRQLSDGNSLGTVMGIATSDVLRFYGAFGNSSGVVQLGVVGSSQGALSTAPVSTGGANNVTTWAFTTSTQANMVISTCIALWNLGIIG